MKLLEVRDEAAFYRHNIGSGWLLTPNTWQLTPDETLATAGDSRIGPPSCCSAQLGCAGLRVHSAILFRNFSSQFRLTATMIRFQLEMNILHLFMSYQWKLETGELNTRLHEVLMLGCFNIVVVFWFRHSRTRYLSRSGRIRKRRKAGGRQERESFYNSITRICTKS